MNLDATGSCSIHGGLTKRFLSTTLDRLTRTSSTILPVLSSGDGLDVGATKALLWTGATAGVPVAVYWDTGGGVTPSDSMFHPAQVTAMCFP